MSYGLAIGKKTLATMKFSHTRIVKAEFSSPSTRISVN